MRLAYAHAAGSLTFQGRNRVALTAQDERLFVLVARLCRKRSVEQVRAMMPLPETVEAAMQRVKRAVRVPSPLQCQSKRRPSRLPSCYEVSRRMLIPYYAVNILPLCW